MSQSLHETDTFREAYQKAVRYLSRYEASTGRLRDKLRQAAYPPPIINAVLDQLLDQGLLDDVRMAEAFLQGRRPQDAEALYPLRLRLRRRGLHPEAIDEALRRDGRSNEDWARLYFNSQLDRLPLEALWAGALDAEERANLRAQLTRLLNRGRARGFSLSLGQNLIRHYLQQQRENTHDAP